MLTRHFAQKSLLHLLLSHSLSPFSVFEKLKRFNSFKSSFRYHKFFYAFITRHGVNKRRRRCSMLSDSFDSRFISIVFDSFLLLLISRISLSPALETKNHTNLWMSWSQEYFERNFLFNFYDDVSLTGQCWGSERWLSYASEGLCLVLLLFCVSDSQ